jgi:tetratricopeptide (TPR) repeat protein
MYVGATFFRMLILSATTLVCAEAQVNNPACHGAAHTRSCAGRLPSRNSPTVSNPPWHPLNSNYAESPELMKGWISGTVRSTTQEGVPDATILLRNAAGTVMTVPNSPDGNFELQGVPAGEYELVVQNGLAETRTSIAVTAGANFVTLTIPSAGKLGQNDGSMVSAAQLAVPKKARHEYEKAENAARRNKWAEANQYLQRALDIWPKFAEALVLRAIIERNQYSSKQAITDAEKAVDSDPSYAKAYVVLGAVYTDVNRSDDAVRALDHGERIAPDYWQGYYEMSRTLLLKRDFAGALQQAQKASDVGHTNFAMLHLIKGYAYLGLSNQPAARTELETYVNLEPKSEAALRVRTILERMSNPATDPANRSSAGLAGKTSPFVGDTH